MTPAEKLAKKKNSVGKPPWGQRGNRREGIFKSRVKELRTRLGLTQLQVQAGAGVTGLHEIEQGCELVLSSALKLAKFFGVAVEEIWEPVK